MPSKMYSDLSNHSKLHTTVLELFSAQSEEVKSAAAFALGMFRIKTYL